MHGQRRQWVWAKLGLAPLATALEPLARLARETERALTGLSTSEIAEAYTEWGWKADGDVLDALAQVEGAQNVEAIGSVIRAVYRPWIEKAATVFQSFVGEGRPDTYPIKPLPLQQVGTCLLYVDGLRMDIAQRLSKRLGQRGLNTEVGWRLTALPPITATARPAVTPVGQDLHGGPELSPATDAGTAVDVTVLRKLLKETPAHYQVLGPNDLLGDPNGLAWAEAGDFDENGHTKGVGLVYQLDSELRLVEHRVGALLDEGWKRVVVVTDHGFLLMPGGLPKVQLPEHLVTVRKGRCARLKPFSVTEQQTVAWHWDENVRFAMAPGIACFEAGKEYEHGGLSPQECVTPV
ncbi:MAG: BREX-1 system phosphatase PglZ type B, partial [Dehalococcoidia bacterium]|nr:BREX-1 system phosphatase PglZ type B [Dehalococcoidia bacterium]